MTAAEELTAAADKLGVLTAGATDGPWTAHYGSDLHTDAAAWIGAPGRSTDDGVFVATTANAVEGLGDAAYIAAMNPLVGKALAEWMRKAARNATEHLLGWDAEAVVLARLINGSES